MAKALEYNDKFEEFMLWFRKNKGLLKTKPLTKNSLKFLIRILI
jgi:hypothetical protein